MKSIISFFKKITIGKKVILITIPIISVLVNMKSIIIGLWLIVFIDLITGIRKSMHDSSVPFNIFNKSFWLIIKSYMLRKTWKKVYEYNLGILLFVIFESMVLGVTPITIIGKVFTLSELSAIIPCIVEVWSIFENFEAVSGKNLLKRISSLLPDSVKKILNINK